jgi:hypothetical protein
MPISGRENILIKGNPSGFAASNTNGEGRVVRFHSLGYVTENAGKTFTNFPGNEYLVNAIASVHKTENTSGRKSDKSKVLVRLIVPPYIVLNEFSDMAPEFTRLFESLSRNPEKAIIRHHLLSSSLNFSHLVS